MSQVEVYDSRRYKDLERVADLYMEGKNATVIAKATGIARKEVLNLIADWKESSIVDQATRDIARDTLNKMVGHYDKLIVQYYDLLRDLRAETFTHQIAAQINSSLKNIAELEAKRVDALQKAGILDASDMGDEMVKMEEKQAIIIDILSNDLCPSCKAGVAQKLSTLTGRVEPVIVYD